MTPTTTMTIRVPVNIKDRLEALAKATDRSKAYLAGRAIEEYLQQEEWQVQAITEAVQKADQPDAVFLDHADVLQRMSERKNRKKDSR